MPDRSTKPTEKPVHWVGSSKKDLLSFPKQVVSDMGYALGLAQLGGKSPEAKPWKGQGAMPIEPCTRCGLKRRSTSCMPSRRNPPRGSGPVRETWIWSRSGCAWHKRTMSEPMGNGGAR